MELLHAKRLDQWFPTREEFYEFREGISTLWLSYLFIVSVVFLFKVGIGSFN